LIPLLPKFAAFLPGPQGARNRDAMALPDDCLDLRNPSDESVLAKVSALGAREAVLAVRRALRAFAGAGRHMGPDDRSRRLRRLADRLPVGTVWVNSSGENDAASPFGGIRASGHGREMGRAAIDLYSQTKSVWLA
jgi:acyl-CoA reductase-like NAD-dependent aldehyde dehydrogenase